MCVRYLIICVIRHHLDNKNNIFVTRVYNTHCTVILRSVANDKFVEKCGYTFSMRVSSVLSSIKNIYKINYLRKRGCLE